MAIKYSTTRKGFAIGLAVVGIAGLSMASASQLNIGSQSAVQTGSVMLEADCQTSPLTVTFDTPSAESANIFQPQHLTVGTIDSACLDYNYKLALLGSNGSLLPFGEFYSGGNSPKTPAQITVDLAERRIDTNLIAGVALTIYK